MNAAADGLVFKSKVDSWLLVILGISILIPIVLMILTARSASRSPGGWIIFAIMMPLMMGIPAWLLTSTTYTILPDALVVKSGPVNIRIALQTITAITPSRSILSAPALSLDRLAITYGYRSTVLISPKEKIEFLDALIRAGVPSSVVRLTR